MKALALPQWKLPSLALVSLFVSHFFYILFLFKYSAQPRFISYLVIGYLISLTFEALLRNITGKRSEGLYLIWVPLAIANSTFINAEVTSIWGLVLALAIAMLSKVVLLDKSGRHIFNPSMVGVVAACVFFPSLMTMSLHSFGVLWPENIVLIIVGLITVILARTWMVGLTYHLGVLACYFLISSYWTLIDFDPYIEGIYTPSFRVLAQTTTGIIILTFGVISDPKTAPRGWRGQAFFGLTIAVIDVILRENSMILSEGLAYLGAQGLWAFQRDFLKSKSLFIGWFTR